MVSQGTEALPGWIANAFAQSAGYTFAWLEIWLLSNK